MKKILLAIGENKLPEGAFEFIRQLNDINPVLLTGVFLREIIYTSDPTFSYYGMVGGSTYNAETEAIIKEDISKRITWFEKSCQKNNIEYRVHNDTDDLIVHELVKETRFADLLVVSAEAFYQLADEREPEGYLKSILHLSECPVLVVPNKFSFPEKTILTYNGSESSVYAIKQFAYVLKEFCNKDTVVVFEANDEEEMPEAVLIHELVARHFNTPTFLMLYKDMSKLSAWATAQQSPILVTGSYSRSEFSEVFRKSFAAHIIRGNKMPVFIAHR